MRIEAGGARWRELREQGKIVRVFLDDVEVSLKCTVADEEAGYVEVLVLDAKGLPQFDPDNFEEKWVERLTGRVRIEIADDK